jgi:hypothetical protein
MVERSHHIQGPDKLLFSDITHAYTLPDLGDERYALLAVSMLDGILAALPGEFVGRSSILMQLKIRRTLSISI